MSWQLYELRIQLQTDICLGVRGSATRSRGLAGKRPGNLVPIQLITALATWARMV